MSSYSSGSNSSASSIEIPEYLHSYETLIFCDFNPFMASVIFNNYQNSVETRGEDCVDFDSIMGQTLDILKANAYDEGDDWETALLELGANQHLINRLMNPDLKDVRLSRTAKEWIWYITSSRYNFLQLLDAGVKERAQKAKARQGKMSISTSHAVSSAANSSSKISVASSKDKTAEECHTFYKGGVLERLQSAEGPGKSIFSELLSTPPGDFGAITGGFCFSKHRQVAWEDAQMAAKIIDGRNQIPVGILTIKIPVNLLANSYTIPEDEWRAFVFANRRRELRNVLAMNYLNACDWIQGPICGQSTALIKRMTSKDELILTEIDGETEHQIFTGKLHMLVAVEERAQPTITVEEIFLTPQKK